MAPSEATRAHPPERSSIRDSISKSVGWLRDISCWDARYFSFSERYVNDILNIPDGEEEQFVRLWLSQKRKELRIVRRAIGLMAPFIVVYMLWLYKTGGPPATYTRLYLTYWECSWTFIWYLAAMPAEEHVCALRELSRSQTGLREFDTSRKFVPAESDHVRIDRDMCRPLKQGNEDIREHIALRNIWRGPIVALSVSVAFFFLGMHDAILCDHPPDMRRIEELRSTLMANTYTKLVAALVMTLRGWWSLYHKLEKTERSFADWHAQLRSRDEPTARELVVDKGEV